MAKFHPPWMRHWIQISHVGTPIIGKRFGTNILGRLANFVSNQRNIFILLGVGMVPRWVRDFPFLEGNCPSRARSAQIHRYLLRFACYLPFDIIYWYKLLRVRNGVIHMYYIVWSIKKRNKTNLNVTDIFVNKCQWINESSFTITYIYQFEPMTQNQLKSHKLNNSVNSLIVHQLYCNGCHVRNVADTLFKTKPVLNWIKTSKIFYLS